METIPGGAVFQPESETAVYVNVPASHKDPVTGATWVHRDLVQVQDAWAESEHVGPVQEHVQVGDIESFTAYILAFAQDDAHALVTWNQSRLMAVLDYHETNKPGRCQWIAEYPFELSREWKAWMELCAGAKSQQTAVDKLDDLADGIVEPAGAELMTIIRGLRANVKKEAVSEYLANGDVKVSFAAEASVRATTGGPDSVTLPSEIRIGIPVLKGHVEESATDPTKLLPVLYEMTVKLRASVDEHSHVTLRFSIPQAEKVLEEVIVERVAAAKALLGEAFSVYRAAD